MKKLALAGVVSNPVLSMSSHNTGWTMVLRSLLKTHFKQDIDIITEKNDWNDYDIIFLTEGVNYREGSFNFFGGVQEKQIIRLEKFSKFKGQVYSLCGTLDYNIVMQKRKELRDYDFEFDIPKNIDILNFSKKLVLGDSHSISVFRPGFTISRNDGKTLRGFLNKGLKHYVKEYISDLIFYAGNIDIRFHMFNPKRKGHYTYLCDELIERLEEQLYDLNVDNNKITCVKLIPIEDESRKLPKTGQLDGFNFYGSFEQRLEAVNYFNEALKDMCNHNGFNILSWDFDYGQSLDFSKMEARQSVHLRPESYMFKEELC